METQAILTSFHFIRKWVSGRSKFTPTKSTPQDIERKTLYDRQDIKVMLFIGHKIKLKFLIIPNMEVRYIIKSSLGIFFSYR